MNNHRISYLADSKRGLIWMRVGNGEFSLDADVNTNPKHYFQTLTGIRYMRDNPELAKKLFKEYQKHYLSNDINDNDEGENFSRN